MIDFYTAPTPNGHKVSCTLEAMELDYETHIINCTYSCPSHQNFVFWRWSWSNWESP